MTLKDRVLQPLSPYISLSELLFLITKNTNAPLYDICIYLLQARIGNHVQTYRLNKHFEFYEWTLKDTDNRPPLDSILYEIATNLKMNDHDKRLCVYSLKDLDKLQEFSEYTKRYFYTDFEKDLYYRREQLADFTPLTDLVNENLSLQQEYNELAELRKECQHLRGLVEVLSSDGELFKAINKNKEYEQIIMQLEQQLQATDTIKDQTGKDRPRPKPRHTNTALQALNAVLDELWADYNPKRPNTAPKQTFVKQWIMDNYKELPENKALWIDKIIRHNVHPTPKK